MSLFVFNTAAVIKSPNQIGRHVFVYLVSYIKLNYLSVMKDLWINDQVIDYIIEKTYNK